MDNSIFINKESYDKFHTILLDNEFSLKKFWFRRVVFQKIIDSKWKIQHSTSIKLLNIYNFYYKTNLSLKDLFKMNLLMNKWNSKEIEFEFQKFDTKDVVFNFIEEVLGRVKKA
jgi:hypothetical protein